MRTLKTKNRPVMKSDTTIFNLDKAIETLSETDIQKVYSLLLEVTQMPNTYPY